MNSYELSRAWFDFCFENPEKINPNHSAIYFFAIEHCNRLGWKEKFGLPSQMVMEAIGIKNWRTYIKAFNDLIDWGFLNLIEKSKNQYSANVIAIVKNTTPNTKALDKALQKHSQKHYKSIVSINKQETRNKKHINKFMSEIDSDDLQDQNLKIAYEFWKMIREYLINKNIKTTIIDKAKQNWSDDIRRMIEIDKINIKDIREIFIWLKSQKDKQAIFWIKNIQSTSKLRQQFPKLQLDMKQNKGPSLKKEYKP